ncbi:MAG: hypothetical protein K6U03_01360 [Firmicutes bacterium]|nr:hypothetical protein [Bacillota bacterium]
MRSSPFRDRGRLLLGWVQALVVLGFLGPLAGRATLRQTLVLALIIGTVLWLVDAALRALRPGDPYLPAAGEGLLAVFALRYLAGAIGAEFGWPGALVLGLAIGLLGLVRAEGWEVFPA